MSEDIAFDERLRSLLLTMAETGVHNAASGLSRMVGETLIVSKPEVRIIPLADLPVLFGGPENEAVGIYLQADNKLAGQIMLVIPYEKARQLVDMIMGIPEGTTQNLGSMERSALAEVGNLTGTYFLNAVAAATGLESRPSPPAVIVDMIGAILNILLATWDGLSENVLMIQATFLRGDREAEANLWVIPNRSTLEAVARKASSQYGQ
jgi:chemotaxis protein CheC